MDSCRKVPALEPSDRHQLHSRRHTMTPDILSIERASEYEPTSGICFL